MADVITRRHEEVDRSPVLVSLVRREWPATWPAGLAVHPANVWSIVAHPRVRIEHRCSHRTIDAVPAKHRAEVRVGDEVRA